MAKYKLKYTMKLRGDSKMYIEKFKQVEIVNSILYQDERDIQRFDNASSKSDSSVIAGI